MYITLANQLNKNPDPKCEAYKHLESHHDTIYEADIEGAQEERFMFFQTLNQRLRHLLRHDPIECL